MSAVGKPCDEFSVSAIAKPCEDVNITVFETIKPCERLRVCYCTVIWFMCGAYHVSNSTATCGPKLAVNN
jgi:hypothetical protein